MGAQASDVFYWVVVTVVGGGVPLITFITFWMTLSSRITEAQTLATAAKEAADEIRQLAAAAIAKIDFVDRDLNTMKVDASSRLSALAANVDATSKSLIAAEYRIVESIKEISRSMDSLTSTVTRTLGELASKRHD